MKKLRAADLAAAARLECALENEAAASYENFLKGVNRYRRAPASPRRAAVPAIWRAGATCLRDYGGAGPVVLVVPSLVNRAAILDLEKDRSFLRALRARGFRPLLVDWGAPGREESAFTLDGYMARLEKALDVAHRRNGRRAVPVIGYCMGGLLAVALARIALRKAGPLVLLATPWDFRADAPLAEMRAKLLLKRMDAAPEQATVRPEALQEFFLMQQPFAVVEKFIRFADMKGAAARRFAVLEDWVNDGVPLAAPVARECLSGWYIGNAPARGRWAIGGRIINPAKLRQPSLHVIPQRDRIVPPASAAALAYRMKDASMIRPAFGHVSMLAHVTAPEKLWPQIFDWLALRMRRP